MSHTRVTVCIEPSKIPRPMAERRITSRLDHRGSEPESMIDELFAGTFEATEVEAEFLRAVIPQPFRVTVTKMEPLASSAGVPPDRLRGYEPMWTTERDRYVLARTLGGFLVIKNVPRAAVLIDDDEINTEVVSRMAEAGVQVVHDVPRGLFQGTFAVEEYPVHISVREPTASLYRLRDGRFQIVRDGSFPLLLSGPDHILVRPAFREALRELGATGWTSTPAVLFDPSTRGELRIYDELLIEDDITPETLEDSVRARPNGVWRYDRSHLFVARSIGDALCAKFNTLHSSIAFEGLG